MQECRMMNICMREWMNDDGKKKYEEDENGGKKNKTSSNSNEITKFYISKGKILPPQNQTVT